MENLGKEIVVFKELKDQNIVLTKEKIWLLRVTREYHNCILKARTEILKGLVSTPIGFESIVYIKNLWEEKLKPIFDLTEFYLFKEELYNEKLDSLNTLKRYVYNALEFDEFEELIRELYKIIEVDQANQHKSDMRYQSYDFWSTIGKLASSAVASQKHKKLLDNAAKEIREKLIENAKTYILEDIEFDIGNIYYKLFNEKSLDFYEIVDSENNNLSEFRNFEPVNLLSWIYPLRIYYNQKLEYENVLSIMREIFTLHPAIEVLETIFSLNKGSIENIQKLIDVKGDLKEEYEYFNFEEKEVKYSLEILFDRKLDTKANYFNITDEIISSVELYYGKNKLGKKVYLKDIEVMISNLKKYEEERAVDELLLVEKDKLKIFKVTLDKFENRICKEIIPGMKEYIDLLKNKIRDRELSIKEVEEKLKDDLGDLKEKSRIRKLEKENMKLETSCKVKVTELEEEDRREEVPIKDNSENKNKTKKIPLNKRISRTVFFLLFNLFLGAWIVNYLGPTLSIGKFSSYAINAIGESFSTDLLSSLSIKKTLLFDPRAESNRIELENALEKRIEYTGESGFREFLIQEKSILKEHTIVYELLYSGEVEKKPGLISGIKNGFYVVYYPLLRGPKGIWIGLKESIGLFFMKASIFYYIAYVFSYIFALCLFWAPIGVFMTKEEKVE